MLLVPRVAVVPLGLNVLARRLSASETAFWSAFAEDLRGILVALANVRNEVAHCREELANYQSLLAVPSLRDHTIASTRSDKC